MVRPKLLRYPRPASAAHKSRLCLTGKSPSRLAGQVRGEGTEIDLSRRALIMGILNVTPDSFSDGGRFLDPAQAIRHAKEMVAAGADLIDVGGESTRPGAEPISSEEELRRVIPVIERLSQEIPVPVSIDTYKADVASKASPSGVPVGSPRHQRSPF